MLDKSLINRLSINDIGRLAQLVEQLTLNQRVAGSIPAAPTIYNGLILYV